MLTTPSCAATGCRPHAPSSAARVPRGIPFAAMHGGPADEGTESTCWSEQPATEGPAYISWDTASSIVWGCPEKEERCAAGNSSQLTAHSSWL
jgi:hypothetical protein